MRAREESSLLNAQLAVELRGFTNSDCSFVVVGSIARQEFTPGGDIDWILLLDGMSGPQDFDVALQIKAKVIKNLEGGPMVRILSVVDAYTRECLTLEADISLGSGRVTRMLERVIAERGRPDNVRSDNGPEFTSRPQLDCKA